MNYVAQMLQRKQLEQSGVKKHFLYLEKEYDPVLNWNCLNWNPEPEPRRTDLGLYTKGK